MLYQIGETFTVTLGPHYSLLDVLMSAVIVWGFVICFRAFLVIKGRVKEARNSV